MKAIPQVIAATREKFGRIDILLNNAGIIRRNAILDYTEKDWDEVMDINV